MKLKEFSYYLPKERIAQYPLRDRADAKLLVVERKIGKISHCKFHEIYNFFRKGDAIVLNNTKVFKARLKGKKKTGGNVEILLIKKISEGIWKAMISHAKRTKTDTKIFFDNDIYATVKEKKGTRCHLEFNVSVQEIIKKCGIVPLPHYIRRDVEKNDEKYYQTVFAKKRGSIAAPTAGLHFTKEILNNIMNPGTKIAEITLHIGPGTFKPIRSDDVEEHSMEAEYYEVSDKTISEINRAKRVFGVGTSVCRALESYAKTNQKTGLANIFIYPGFKFSLIDCLITNFHLPCSTTLLLVCAFASKDLIFKAYNQAIENKYRFLSYGDAMLIL